MRTVTLWQDRIPERDKHPNSIWALSFKPDGSQIICAVGNRVLVYDTCDGDLIHSLKGHKDVVYCVAYAKNGKKFASGGADKQVIIWTHKAEGILKYNHNDAIQCLSYNPITQQLASGTATDFGLWSPEQKSVSKHKVRSKILCMAWTSDGLHLALGFFDGHIHLCDKAGAEKVVITRNAPVWTLQWSSSVSGRNGADGGVDVLVAGCWDQTLGFYKIGGQEHLPERKLGYDPTSIAFLGNGEYFVVTGSSGKIQLFTRDGVFLGDLVNPNATEKNVLDASKAGGSGEGEEGAPDPANWSWALAVKPKTTSSFTHNFNNGFNIVHATNSGNITMHQLVLSTIHGLYQERYAFREILTDVIIQHLVTSQKVRIRCREHVKKIALYNDRLAVQLPDRVLIYEAGTNQDPADMHYKNIEKIKQRFECSLLVVTKAHIVLCHERTLQLIGFTGVLEREWTLEALIRYIKVIGGPPRKEGILVGLKSGHVLKIFIDNPFPVCLVKQATAVRCLDLNCTRQKLAVVDEQSNLLVYDVSKTSAHALKNIQATSGGGDESPNSEASELLYTEPHANSVAWNTEMADMLAYSGSNNLCIKTGFFPPHVQKLPGFVVGFKGSKIFCLHYVSMQTVDVPQSASLYRYLEKKQFDTAYKVACLGVTESDWRSFALTCLQNLKFDLARKAFIRIRDVKYIDLLNRLKGLLPIRSEEDEHMLNGHICAFQNQFQEAAEHYLKARQPTVAVDMFTDLRRWDDARYYAEIVEKGGAAMPAVVVASSPEHINDDPLNMTITGDSDGALSGRSGRRSGAGSPSSPGLMQPEASGVSTKLMQRQAATAEEDGDLRQAGEMYVELGKFRRAVEIFCKISCLDALIQTVRKLLPGKNVSEREHKELLLLSIRCFRKEKHHSFAKEAILKLGDIPMLIELHMSNHKWEEAFMVCSAHPEHSALLYLPYAEWLREQDQYAEAIDSYREAGRCDMSLAMLADLADNAVTERRYRDVATLYYKMATEVLLWRDLSSAPPSSIAPSGAAAAGGGGGHGEDSSSRSSSSTPPPAPNPDVAEACRRSYIRRAEIYYLYSLVWEFSEAPFTTMLPENVFNVCVALTNLLMDVEAQRLVPEKRPQDLHLDDADLKLLAGGSAGATAAARAANPQLAAGNKRLLLSEVPQHVSRVHLMFVLSKQAQVLKAYKLARTCFDQLHLMRVSNPHWQQQIDLGSLLIRSKPFSDSEDVQTVCYRCMTTNPMLRAGDACISCGHPFIRCYLTLDVLPLVEFAPEPSVSVEEARRLIQRGGKVGKGGEQGDGWQEGITSGGANTLQLGGGPTGGDQQDLFVQRMLEAGNVFVPGDPYQPLHVDRDVLQDVASEEVFVVDLSHQEAASSAAGKPFAPVSPSSSSDSIGPKFFKNVIPEMPISMCPSCGHFFHSQAWEKETLAKGKCPFCGFSVDKLPTKFQPGQNERIFQFIRNTPAENTGGPFLEPD
ncbi:unnamed protein product [Amoebophrya sp. A25]|nr:unnamed protein product [Amoebophrya sp. A25]|eukprot:GSA25T00024679001.1